MQLSIEEKRANLKAEEDTLNAKKLAFKEEERVSKEVADLLPKELKGEYEEAGDELKVAKEYLTEAKNAVAAAREVQKSVERRIGDILNGEQLKLFLGETAPSVSVGGVGRGKQGQRILDMLSEGELNRKDMVKILKGEFNDADCHGAFDTLKKSGKISIVEGIVALV